MLLDKYAKCKDSKEVLEVQRVYIDDAEIERDTRRAMKDYPPTSSSSSENEDEENAPKTAEKSSK